MSFVEESRRHAEKLQNGYTISCGVREWQGIMHVTPEDFVYSVATHDDGHAFTFVTFSDTTTRIASGAKDPYRKTGGTFVADYIRKNDLGQVWETDELPNRAHGPYNIKVWVWAPDWKKLSDFKQKEAK